MSKRGALLGAVQQAIYDSEAALMLRLEQIRKKHDVTVREMASAIEWDDALLADRYLDTFGDDDE